MSDDAVNAVPTEAPTPKYVYGIELDGDLHNAFESSTNALWWTVRALHTNLNVSAPNLEVWITESVMADSQRAFTHVGIGKEHRVGSDRIGGVVAGKTVVSDDGASAVVLIDASVIAAAQPEDMLTALYVAAHEMCHVLYGLCRTAAGIRAENDLWLPWDIAANTALQAAEEFRCDQLAINVMRLAIYVNDHDGNPIDFTPALLDRHVPSVPPALDRVLPGLAEIVESYRNRKIVIDDMWHQVARTTGELLNFVAHLEGTTSTNGRVLDSIDHPAVDLLRPILHPLINHLRGNDLLLPSRDGWTEDRATIKMIGTAGLTEVWRRLGISFEPRGTGYYLHVNQPEAGPGQPDTIAQHRNHGDASATAPAILSDRSVRVPPSTARAEAACR